MKYFDDFTEEEINKYSDSDFEPIDNGLHHLDCDFTIYKLNDQYYVEREETENCLQEISGSYYILSPTWYMHFDLDSFIQDYTNGSIDSEIFNVEDYAL